MAHFEFLHLSIIILFFSVDSKSLDDKKNESDKGRLSSNTTAYTPSSHVFSKNNKKTSSPGQLLDGVASAKGAVEMQPVNSRGRPGSSASSNSDRAGALPASSGPGLSPSSSMGSLSSEKSTLNPHAKVCLVQHCIYEWIYFLFFSSSTSTWNILYLSYI